MIDYKDKIKEKYKKILFIHGWGFNSQIWENFAAKFFYLDQCHFLDLYSYIEYSKGDLKIASKKILDDYEDIDLIISWSLGCYFAKEIEFMTKIKNIKYVYISYNPKFIKEKFWDFGFDLYILKKLRLDIKKNKENALKNFYLLILGRYERKNLFYKEITKNINLTLKIKTKILNLGLDIIENSDYRNYHYKKNVKNIYIYGDKDEITSISIKSFINEKEPNSIIKVIPNSSHISFVTNSNNFFDVLKECL